MSRPVAVIVPMFNAAATIAETIAALKAQTVPIAQAVLVDDGSTDGCAEAALAAAGDPRFRLLGKERGGEASALNAGLTALFSGAGADGTLPGYVAIVEADVAPDPSWLAALLAEVEGAGGVGGAGGILRGDPHAPWIARLAAFEVERRFPAAPCDVLHITSAASLYRREIFERLGGFREDLVNASLDSEWNWRVRQAGWRLRFTPRAAARHHYKPTLAATLARQYAYGRYRRATPEPFLYARDRAAAVEMSATLFLAAAAGVLLFVSPAAAAACVASACALQIPFAARMWRSTGDPAAPAALIAFPLKHLAGAAGLLGGVLGGKTRRAPEAFRSPPVESPGN